MVPPGRRASLERAEDLTDEYEQEESGGHQHPGPWDTRAGIFEGLEIPLIYSLEHGRPPKRLFDEGPIRPTKGDEMMAAARSLPVLAAARVARRERDKCCPKPVRRTCLTPVSDRISLSDRSL
jgi:hypothetical protein